MRVLLFIAKLILPKNWGLLLLYALNFFLMSLIGYAFTGDWTLPRTYALGIFYIQSIFLILLPFGETILRIKDKAQPINELGNSRIERLFMEVHKELRRKYKILVPRKINLYFLNSDSVNAYALGNKTIIINSGIVNLPDDNIKAIFFHEMSHLIELDSFYNVSLSIGNVFVYVAYIVVRYMTLAFAAIVEFMVRFFVSAFTKHNFSGWEVTETIVKLIDYAYELWQNIGIILCLWSSRQSEYKADTLAKKCGYGYALASFLSQLKEKQATWFDRMYLTHPSNSKRIEKLLK